jgi:hypothetical protein
MEETEKAEAAETAEAAADAQRNTTARRSSRIQRQSRAALSTRLARHGDRGSKIRRDASRSVKCSKYNYWATRAALLKMRAHCIREAAALCLQTNARGKVGRLKEEGARSRFDNKSREIVFNNPTAITSSGLGSCLRSWHSSSAAGNEGRRKRPAIISNSPRSCLRRLGEAKRIGRCALRSARLASESNPATEEAING